MNREVERIRILVVDDERDIREGFGTYLSRLGFQLYTAKRGEEALQIFEEAHPAIVLLDLKMPGMDGMEVLKLLRERDPSLLVIVITGYATVETAIEAMKQGAYDFISKPFEPDQLRIVVNRAADKIRLTREAHKLEQEKARTLSDLDTEKSRLRTIIESLPDGVMVTNTGGQVVLINPSCKHMLRLPPTPWRAGLFKTMYWMKPCANWVWIFPRGNMWIMGISPNTSSSWPMEPTCGLSPSRYWEKERNAWGPLSTLSTSPP